MRDPVVANKVTREEPSAANVLMRVHETNNMMFVTNGRGSEATDTQDRVESS